MMQEGLLRDWDGGEVLWFYRQMPSINHASQERILRELKATWAAFEDRYGRGPWHVLRYGTTVWIAGPLMEREENVQR